MFDIKTASSVQFKFPIINLRYDPYPLAIFYRNFFMADKLCKFRSRYHCEQFKILTVKYVDNMQISHINREE
jgi:hypothetical protein